MNSKSNMGNTLLKVAWASILLGILMELILLALASSFGKLPAFKPILAELVQKISWSAFVCMGVALGTAAAKMRPQLMGLAGFVAGPVAFYAAKALHKSTAEALSIIGPVTIGPSPFVTMLLKGLEYGCLGGMVGWLATKPGAGLRIHALAGFLIGLIFGGLFLWITVSRNNISTYVFLTKAINEILFPVGCSIVLYCAQRFGQKNIE